jgi:quercetin dioxygenase-like cupin family protein
MVTRPVSDVFFDAFSNNKIRLPLGRTQYLAASIAVNDSQPVHGMDSKEGSMKTYSLRTILVVLGALTLQGCSTTAEPTKIEREILLKSSQSWDNSPYMRYLDATPELTVLKLKIPANTQLPWHIHPIPNAGYALSGELIIESRDNGQTTRVKQGEAVAEMVDIAHRGVTGDEPVELIVFYAGSEGIPLSE